MYQSTLPAHGSKPSDGRVLKGIQFQRSMFSKGVPETMGFKLMVLSMHTVEIMFFTGLLGCVVVVLYSWVSVIKGCLADEK